MKTILQRLKCLIAMVMRVKQGCGACILTNRICHTILSLEPDSGDLMFNMLMYWSDKMHERYGVIGVIKLITEVVNEPGTSYLRRLHLIRMRKVRGQWVVCLKLV